MPKISALTKTGLTLMKGNFGSADFGSGYDIIVSGLSTYHLDDTEKLRLYKRIYDSLNQGGVFISFRQKREASVTEQ